MDKNKKIAVGKRKRKSVDEIVQLDVVGLKEERIKKVGGGENDLLEDERKRMQKVDAENRFDGNSRLDEERIKKMAVDEVDDENRFNVNDDRLEVSSDSFECYDSMRGEESPDSLFANELEDKHAHELYAHQVLDESVIVSDSLDCDESLPYGESSPHSNSNSNENYENEHVYHPQQLLEESVVGITMEDSEMLDWMKEREIFYQADASYLTRSERLPVYRARLIDWLQHASWELKLGREAFYMAVNYVDRFLAAERSIDVVRSLKLIGIVSLFIAAKAERNFAPPVEYFISQTALEYTRNQTFALEARITTTLKWYLLPQTCWSWVKFYVGRIVHLIQNIISSQSDYFPGLYENLCSLLELTLRGETIYRIMELIDASILHPAYLQFLPSHVAASALVLVLPVAEYLIDVSNISVIELDPCLQWMQQFLGLPTRFHENYEDFNDSLVELTERQGFHPNALPYVQQIMSNIQL